jgi:acyl dehydratase
MKVLANLSDVPSLVGEEFGPSEWVTIDQKRIQMFADATGDHQWIHVDEERCKREMPGGKTIAHGLLTLSLLPALTGSFFKIEGSTRIFNYGANKIRFMDMVACGSRVRVHQKVLKVLPFRNGGFFLTSEMSVEIEGQEKPALIAESIALIT